MIKKIDLKEIIKANPNVDEKLIQKSQEQRKQLRGIRVKKVGYNIIPPFSRRFIRQIDDTNEDPRSVYLRT